MISWSSSGQLVSFFPLVAGGLDLELVGLGLYHDVGWMCVKEGGVWSSEQAKLFEMMSFRVENRSQNQENSSFPLPLFDRPTDMSFALAGNLALDLDTLSVRLVRVDAPFADEFAARREAAVLERALLDRVEALACCLRQGNDAATPPVAAPHPRSPCRLRHPGRRHRLPSCGDRRDDSPSRCSQSLVGVRGR